jgi:large subunit ribosomal protein L29
MKAAEIRETAKEAVLQEIDRLEKELMHLRFKNKMGTLENPMEIRKTRRTVGRMKTILRERDINKQG